LKEASMRISWRSLVFLLAALAPAAAAAAEPCMVLASMKGSFKADGETHRGKRLVQDCQSVAAVDEELSVCFVTKQRERSCPKLKPGQQFKEIARDAAPAARLPASMRKIADLVTGTQAVVGVSGPSSTPPRKNFFCVADLRAPSRRSVTLASALRTGGG
jgi:hypothetical protein